MATRLPPKPVLRDKSITSYPRITSYSSVGTPPDRYEIEVNLLYYAEDSGDIERVNRAIDELVKEPVSGNTSGPLSGLAPGVYKVDAQGGTVLNNDQIVAELIGRVKNVKSPDERFAIAGWLLTTITNAVSEIVREDAQ